MSLQETITQSLGLDSIGKSLGIESFKNVVPSLKKAYEVAFVNNDKSFPEKIEMFLTSVTNELAKLDGDKAQITADTQDKVQALINTPQGQSVVDSMNGLKESQKEMARLIERMFTERLKQFDSGLTDEAIRRISIAALANSYGESRFNASIAGDGGASVGLFQLHKNGLGHRMYVAWKKDTTNPPPPDPRKDPVKNINEVLNHVTGRLGRNLIAAAKDGERTEKLIEIFVREIENPARPGLDTQKRIAYAKNWFGGDLSPKPENAPQAVASSAPSEGSVSIPIQRGICELKGNQDAWIFGSSSAHGLAKGMLRNNPKFGFLAKDGWSPAKFAGLLESEYWPKISNLKLPKTVFLVGMAVNGVTSDSDVNKAISAYEKIANFLKGKGVQNVKFLTVQLAKGRGKPLDKFNIALRKRHPGDVIDVAKMTSTADNTAIKEGYADAAGIHLNGKGASIMASMIKEAVA